MPPSINFIVLEGLVKRKPNLRVNGDGSQAVTFGLEFTRLATDEGFATEVRNYCWCVLFEPSEPLLHSLRKGARCVVTGSLRGVAYAVKGESRTERRYSLTIVADTCTVMTPRGAVAQARPDYSLDELKRLISAGKDDKLGLPERAADGIGIPAEELEREAEAVDRAYARRAANSVGWAKMEASWKEDRYAKKSEEVQGD